MGSINMPSLHATLNRDDGGLLPEAYYYRCDIEIVKANLSNMYFSNVKH